MTDKADELAQQILDLVAELPALGDADARNDHAYKKAHAEKTLTADDDKYSTGPLKKAYADKETEQQFLEHRLSENKLSIALKSLDPLKSVLSYYQTKMKAGMAESDALKYNQVPRT